MKGKDALVSASNVRIAVFFFPVLRNTFNRIKQSRTSKAVTLLCLPTKNKKAVNNQASMRVSAALFAYPAFLLPTLTPELFVYSSAPWECKANLSPT